VTGRRDRIIVSAVAGLGDRLVGGEVDGDNYVIDAATGALLAAPDNGALTPADIATVAALASKVEETRGAPQDIEWAFEGDRLYLCKRGRSRRRCAHPPDRYHADHFRQFETSSKAIPGWSRR